MIYFGQHAHLSRFPEPPSKKIIVGQNRCLVCISYYPKDTQTTLNVQTGKLMCPTPRMVRGITVRVGFDPKFTQTVLVHSLLGISQGDIISRNLAGGSLLGSLLEQ